MTSHSGLSFIYFVTLVTRDSRYSRLIPDFKFFFRKLNEVLPLPRLQHLKRVKSLKEGSTTRIYLLLWSLDPPTCDINSALVIAKLQSAGVDVSALSAVFRRELVAAFAPLTRNQFEALKVGI